MKKETRQKIVNYDVYVAFDGKEFEKEDDCRLHEKIVRGEAKICPECNGEGRITVWEKDEDYHTGAPIEILCTPTCPKCHGRGYLEKIYRVTWE